MKMYVLQVRTGQETRLAQRLRRRGVDAHCPQEERAIRRGGSWQNRLYTIFPGYLFVRCEDPLAIYYKISGQSGVLRWLGMQGGTPMPLPLDEEAQILCMTYSDVPLPPSRAVKTPDGGLMFVEGPLAELAGSIRRVHRHDRRAEVRVPLHGREQIVRLSFTIE